MAIAAAIHGMQTTTCIRCDYDLTGLADDAVCPECALPIRRSRERTRLLRSADSRWLGIIRRGMADLQHAMMILFVSMLLLIALLLLISMLRIRLGGSILGLRYEDAILVAVGTVVGVLHIRGCIRLGIQTHADYAAPKWARAALLTCGLALPVTVVLTLFWSGWLRGLSSSLRLPLFLLFQVNALVFYFALAAILRHFEERTASWSVGDRIRHNALRRNLVIFILIVAVIYWLPRLHPFFLLPIGVSDWGLLLFGLAYVLLGGTVMRVQGAVATEELIAEELQRAEGAAKACLAAQPD